MEYNHPIYYDRRGNGGCAVFAVLALVFVIFAAGYMLAESNAYALQNQVGERALEMTSQTIATLAPQATQAAELRAEVARLQAEASAAIAAQVQAENARIAAEAARKQAENALAEAIAARDRAENEHAAAEAARRTAEANLAAAEGARQTAEANLAAVEKKLAEAEHNLAVAYAIYEDQQARIDRLEGEVTSLRGELAAAQRPVIPVSGKVKNLTGKLVSSENLLPMLGFALFGLVMGAAVTRLVSPSSNCPEKEAEAAPAVKRDSRYTYVKMTREEARQYARRRAR